jgi:hypothetical protein
MPGTCIIDNDGETVFIVVRAVVERDTPGRHPVQEKLTRLLVMARLRKRRCWLQPH